MLVVSWLLVYSLPVANDYLIMAMMAVGKSSTSSEQAPGENAAHYHRDAFSYSLGFLCCVI